LFFPHKHHLVRKMAFWAVEVVPNKAFTVVPPFDLHLTQIVLPASAKDKGRSVVEVKHDDKSFAVGALKLDVAENISLDLMFEAGKTVTFSVSGNNAAHLVGYYIDHDDHGEDFSDDELEGLGFGGEDEEIDSDEDDLDDDEDDIDEDELTGATLQALTNQKRKGEQQPQANGAKKAKVGFQEPKAQQKPQQPKGEQKPQQPKGEQKPQQPKGEQKPQQQKPQQQKPQQPKGEKSPQQQQRPQTPELKEGSTRIVKGVKVETRFIGLGNAAQPGKKVFVQYTGKLENGKVFDKSKSPFGFVLGAGDVISG